jgi:hypothetical protein
VGFPSYPRFPMANSGCRQRRHFVIFLLADDPRELFPSLKLGKFFMPDFLT